MPIELLPLHGDAITPHLAPLAQLRLTVFREWPYLYDGTLAAELDYLHSYLASPRSIVVLARDGDQIVGATTGLPLADAHEEFQTPFRDSPWSPDDIFYLGESVLLAPYRGQGLGHAFFDHREQHAAALGTFRLTSFCAVQRDPDDPRRPPDYRPLDPFWQKRGYQRQNHLRARFHWKEVNAPGETRNTLTFWTKPVAAVSNRQADYQPR